MGFQLSPGIAVREFDYTSIIPSVATTDACICLPLATGPVDKIVLIDQEDSLVQIFGPPVNESLVPNSTGAAAQWLTASSFLAYGNKLHVIRCVGNTARNSVATVPALLIKNEDVWDNNYSNGEASVGAWAARYPGKEYGDALEISFVGAGAAGGASAFNSTTNVTANVDTTIATPIADSAILNISVTSDLLTGNTTVFGGVPTTFAATSANLIANISSILTIGSKVTFPTSANFTGKYEVLNYGVARTHPGTLGHTWLQITPNPSAAAGNLTASVISNEWKHADSFVGAPGTSLYVAARSGSNDECHIAVTDATGIYTGTSNTLLETYAGLSAARDAKNEDGTSNYYKDVIRQSSRYIYWMDHPTGTQGYGETAAGTKFVSPSSPVTNRLTGGITDNDDDNSMLSARVAAYQQFADAETTDISLILTGNGSTTRAIHTTLVQQVIDNVALARLDCVAFFSPIPSDTVGQSTQASAKDAVIATKNAVDRSTSYAVMDSGHKQMYDRYNDLYRAVPLNGDIAGLCVRTDDQRDPWWSPGGLNRGQLKNVTYLHFSPRKSFRDELYKNNINPVVSLPGEGPVLFGDKTLQTKPSAFDRINVRRLFIVLEKAIARAAKYTLFEFNDSFTRAQFRNMVEPFLEDVKGRRGIYDFKVVCDESNNPGVVVDRNEFISDILIKPARSINFITLNFVALGTSVSFEEIG